MTGTQDDPAGGTPVYDGDDPYGDPEQLEELAAEPDEPGEPDEAEAAAPGRAGADADEADEEPHHYTGVCAGGPYDGHTLVSRFPEGVLLVDKAARRVWIYDYDPARHVFHARSDAPAGLDDAGRWRAALEPAYDVRAYEPGFDGDPDPADDGDDDGAEVPA